MHIHNKVLIYTCTHMHNASYCPVLSWLYQMQQSTN